MPSFDLPSDDNRMPRPYALDSLELKKIEAYEEVLRQSLVAIKENPQASAPHFIFDKYKEMKKDAVFCRVDVNDDLLQSLQHYTQAMIRACRRLPNETTYRTVAGLYTKWMACVRGEEYGAERITDMIDANADWIFDNAAHFDDHYMALGAMDETLKMQNDLLDAKKIEPKTVCSFIYRHVPQLVTDAIASGENGLEEGMYDPTRTEKQGISMTVRHLYLYSYPYRATQTYCAALDLMKKAAPKKGVPSLITAVQPALSIALATKVQETHLINETTGEVHPRRMPDTTSAITCFTHSAAAMRDTLPERIGTFLLDTYQDVAEEFILNDDSAALADMYDACHAIIPDDAEPVKKLLQDYAARTADRLIDEDAKDTASFFIDHVRKKTHIPQAHLLFLLDENKKTIIAASVPLTEKGKVVNRAVVLFSKDQPQQVTSLIVDRSAPTKGISYRAAARGPVIKDHFVEQAQEAANKIVAHGMDMLHDSLSARWRVANVNAF